MKNLQTLILISIFTFFASCAPLEYQENVRPTFSDTQLKSSEYEITTLPAPDKVEVRKTAGCNCRITLDASPLVQQSNWIHDFAFFTPTNQTYMAHTYSVGAPDIPLPRSYDIPVPITRNTSFYQELPFDYFANPIERGGTFTFKLACEVAPPYIKTFHLPSVYEVGGGTRVFRAVGRVTNDCGTIGLELEND